MTYTDSEIEKSITAYLDLHYCLEATIKRIELELNEYVPAGVVDLEPTLRLGEVSTSDLEEKLRLFPITVPFGIRKIPSFQNLNNGAVDLLIALKDGTVRNYLDNRPK